MFAARRSGLTFTARENHTLVDAVNGLFSRRFAGWKACRLGVIAKRYDVVVERRSVVALEGVMATTIREKSKRVQLCFPGPYFAIEYTTKA
jgi:hypothetical protein